MPNDTDWITAVIAKARQQSIQVPNDLWTHLDALLNEKLSQRPLPPGELASIAMQSIELMAFAPTKIKESQ